MSPARPRRGSPGAQRRARARRGVGPVSPACSAVRRVPVPRPALSSPSFLALGRHRPERLRAAWERTGKRPWAPSVPKAAAGNLQIAALLFCSDFGTRSGVLSPHGLINSKRNGARTRSVSISCEQHFPQHVYFHIKRWS